jgi:hypothetical protein
VLTKKITLAFLICLLVHNAAFALSDGSNFLIVPSAEVIGDKAFQVRGTIGYHQSSCADGLCDRLPFVPSFRFGLFNSLDFGVQFGRNVSLDVKDQINKAFGVIPSFAIGARAFVQSPEAYFYSVSKSDSKGQTGEFYTTAEWGGEWWRFLGGVSAFPLMEANSVAPFWGFEQGIGTPKFTIVYEGFFRHGFSHHNMGLSLKPVKSFNVSFGASEFYRYFFNNDGDFGFRTKNPGASTGYRAPGIYMSLAINGGFSPGIQSQKIEVDSLKKQLAVQDKDLTDLRSRLDNLESLYYDPEFVNSDYVQNLQREFMDIVNGYKSDTTSLDSLLAKEKSFMDREMAAKRFLVREAKNKKQPEETRIMAIRIMSHFPDPAFLEHLGNLVADNSNVTIAREAALALGTINTPEARRTLAMVANQTTGIVRETIIEILGSL